MGTKQEQVKNKEHAKYIFWCHTDLPENYVYIFSSSASGAKRIYASEFGIPLVNIEIKKICPVPASVLSELNIRQASGFASEQLLDKVGIEFLTREKSVARYEGKIHRESNFLEKYLKASDYTGPRLYLLKVKGKKCYKIGFSGSVTKRSRQVEGPAKLDVITFTDTPLAAALEERIKHQFRKFHIGKEFHELDAWGEKLLLATFELYHIEYVKQDERHIGSDSFHQKLKILIALVARHKLKKAPSKEDKEALKPVRLFLDQHAAEQLQSVAASILSRYL